MMKSKLKDWDKELSGESSDSDDGDGADAGGDGSEVNDDWSDEDDKLTSASKRRRIHA